MSKPLARVAKIASHFVQPIVQIGDSYEHTHNIHTLSIASFLPRAAAIEPDAEAIYHVTSNGKTIRRTYREFSDRAAALANAIKARRWRRVGILCPNTPAFLELIFATAGIGAVQVGVNYRLKADDIAYIFNHAEVDVVFVDAEYESLLEDFRQKYPRVKIVVDDDTDVLEGSEAGEYNRLVQEGFAIDRQSGDLGWSGLKHTCDDENETIALAYTSGTTARPKGVEYTSRGVYLAAMANVIESGLSPATGRCRYLWTLPMFHALGWTFPIAITAVRGTHVCLRKIDYPVIWRLLKEEGITHYNAAPTVNTLLCSDTNAEKLPQPVRVTVAASPPSAKLFQQMIALNLHPVHVYGLTETYGPITKGYILPEWSTIPEQEKYQKMARQGHGFIASLPVRVIKTGKAATKSTLEDVARNGEEIGEVVCAGNVCAKGYYKDAQATRKLFEGGVLHTGDLAVWHKDNAIQILDRAKDIIISGGENISSVALEGYLMQHDEILEAAVIAVPDEQWGERPKAFITIKQGRKVKAEDVISWARKHKGISRFMVPREVEVVIDLPKTSTGKVQKVELRRLAKEKREKDKKST